MFTGCLAIGEKLVACKQDESTKQRGSGVHEETISSGASTRSNSPVPQPPSEAPPRPVHPPPVNPTDAYLRTVPSPPPMHSHPYGGNWQPHPSLNGVSFGLNLFGRVAAVSCFWWRFSTLLPWSVLCFKSWMVVSGLSLRMVSSVIYFTKLQLIFIILF